jgi:hypothetical protein
MADSPPLRRSAASQLRFLADRLDPRQQIVARRPHGPLVRYGGRWWHRDELVGPLASDEPPEEVDLDA